MKALRFLAFAFCIIAGACSKKETVTQPPADPRMQPLAELPAPAAIEHFDPLLGPTVIVTANEAEHSGVILTLKERDKKRAAAAKMTFHRISTGLHKVVWNVRQNNVLQPATVWIVNASSVAPHTLAQHVPPGQSRIVALRGHTSDMESLRAYAAPYMSRYCLVLVGGCDSSHFLRTHYASERPILGDYRTAESANNTYLLIRSIDLIGGRKVASWAEYASTLQSDSARAAVQSFIPGQPGYGLSTR